MYELRDQETEGFHYTTIVVDGHEYAYTGPTDEESVQKVGDEISVSERAWALYSDAVTLAAMELELDADDGEGLENIHATAHWMSGLGLDLTADETCAFAKRIFSNRTFFNFVLAAVDERDVAGDQHQFIEGGPLDVGLQKAAAMSRAIRRYT